MLPEQLARTAKTLINALRHNDKKLAQDILFKKERDSEQTKRRIELWSQAFGKYLDELRIIASVFCGKQMILFWEVNLDGRRIVRRFVFTNEEGRLCWDTSESGNKIAILLNDSLQISGLPVQPSEAAQSLFEYILPETASTSNPVSFICSAKEANVDLSEHSSKGKTAISFFAGCYRDFRDEPLPTYGQQMTSLSKRKFVSWSKRLSAQEFQSYRESMLANRRYLMFVLNAYPFQLLFFRTKTSSPLTNYEYIYRDKNGKYSITNFGFERSLDDILRDANLFSTVAVEEQIQKRVAASVPVKGLSDAEAQKPTAPVKKERETTDTKTKASQTPWKILAAMLILGVGVAVLVWKRRK